MALVRIPKVFYDDHTSGRDLPAPPVVVEGRRHYYIETTHPDAGELLADAEFYADRDGPTFSSGSSGEVIGFASSARATAHSLRKAGVK